MLQVTVTFDLLTPKSVGIIFGSWPTKTLFLRLLNTIGITLLSGQGVYVQGHCDLDL